MKSMNKLLNLIIFCVVTFCVMCVFDGCAHPNQTSLITTERLPAGTIILKQYDNGWAKWKLENECFLSRGLTYSGAVLTKVDCPKEK